MERRTTFPGVVLPLLLVGAAAAADGGVSFCGRPGRPCGSARSGKDAFGLRSVFVGFENFADLFEDPLYRDSIGRTVAFCVAVAVLAMSVALLLAVFADRDIRGRAVYRTLLIWPYAIAPAMAAVLWILVLHPQIGLVGRWLNRHGLAWDYKLRDGQAFGVVVMASAWKQVSYDFIFFPGGAAGDPRGA